MAPYWYIFLGLFRHFTSEVEMKIMTLKLENSMIVFGKLIYLEIEPATWWHELTDIVEPRSLWIVDNWSLY